MIINDKAIILKNYDFQEKHKIFYCLTKEHGLITGISKYANSKRKNKFNVGDLVQINWKARLNEHLGILEIEPLEHNFSHIYHDELKLLMLSIAAQLLPEVINQHEKNEQAFEQVLKFIADLKTELSIIVLIREYLILCNFILELSGFGLDLSRCAVTDTADNLYYVSPKSGCAVVKEVGDPYKERLFRFPNFLLNSAIIPTNAELENSLKMIMYFLKDRVLTKRFDYIRFDILNEKIINNLHNPLENIKIKSDDI